MTAAEVALWVLIGKEVACRVSTQSINQEPLFSYIGENNIMPHLKFQKTIGT